MNTSVNIAGVTWKNPVTVASGTFGSGAEDRLKSVGSCNDEGRCECSVAG